MRMTGLVVAAVALAAAVLLSPGGFAVADEAASVPPPEIVLNETTEIAGLACDTADMLIAIRDSYAVSSEAGAEAVDFFMTTRGQYGGEPMCIAGTAFRVIPIEDLGSFSVDRPGGVLQFRMLAARAAFAPSFVFYILAGYPAGPSA